MGGGVISPGSVDLTGYAKTADISAAAASNLAAMQALIPALATTAPPAVAAVSSVVGTGTMAARDNHTHATSVQRRRIPVTLTAGIGTVTFPTAYAVVPAVNVDVETPTGASALNLCSVVQDSITTSGFQIAVNKLPMNLTIALGNLALISVQTGTVYVNYLAGIPTA